LRFDPSPLLQAPEKGGRQPGLAADPQLERAVPPGGRDQQPAGNAAGAEHKRGSLLRAPYSKQSLLFILKHTAITLQECDSTVSTQIWLQAAAGELKTDQWHLGGPGPKVHT